jgi:arylsulfatase A-like enzyme
MSKTSIVFERFYAAAPVCSPTRASVLTGRNNMRNNVPCAGHYLRPNEITIAEALKDAGYVTGQLGKWHIGSVQPQSPTSPGQVGFDEWLTNPNFFDKDPYFAKNGEYIQIKGQGTVITMDATIDFLQRHKDGDKPMFAVTWFPSPHDPHAELPENLPNLSTLYRDLQSQYGVPDSLRGYYLETTLLDQQVGRLRRALRSMNIADNTLIWFCSDNGGLSQKYSGGRGKKGSIYEGGLRVPALLEWPAKLQHRAISTPINTSDIYPTLIEIAQAKVSHQPTLDGVSLIKVLKGSTASRPPMGFWHRYTPGHICWGDKIVKSLLQAQEQGKPDPHPELLLRNVEEFPKRDRSNFNGHAAWLDYPWKLHRIVKDKKESIELYKLDSDPMEANDLSKTNPEKANAMLKQLDTWQNSVFDSWEGKDYQKK